jgi:hypothetical protein
VAHAASIAVMFSKYLSLYQPRRIRSMSSLKVSFVSRLPSKMLMLSSLYST